MKLYAATTTDGYKVGHAPMYSDGTEQVYANLTPRSDRLYRQKATSFYDGRLVVFGNQGTVQEVVEMWDESFFKLPKEVAVGRYKRRMDAYLGEDVVDVSLMEQLHDLGYLPLEIKGIREGSRVPMGIPIMTMTNTLPAFFWLVNYLETVISCLTWKSCTNATIAFEYKKIIKHFGELTGTDEFTQSLQCHAFSARGMSGPEDSARSDAAHLTAFIGTDSLGSMDYVEDYYGAGGLIAISVPATEHAVATSNILRIEKELIEEGLSDTALRLEAERDFMDDLITRKFPKGIVSYVADSFDFWSVITKILPVMKETIMAREARGMSPGKLVIRPDSGDPVKVVCGYKEGVDGYWAFYDVGGDVLDKPVFIDNDGNEVPDHEVKGAVECLWETFGGTITDKGFKMLDSHIGLIYGDSITTQRALDILQRLMEKGFASGNILFGVGSYTYQCNTRDTFGFAVKATYTVVNGVPINIFKDPATDAKKKSAKGLLFVGKNTDGWYLADQVSPEEEASAENKLQLIFRNGEFFNMTTLMEIRERLQDQL